MFPNEPKQYRAARRLLLRAEIALRRQAEKVAALRRKLPAGGKVPQDYVFEEGEPPCAVKLSDLFGERDSLVAYSFMFGPRMANACPMCTSMLDSLDGNAPHIAALTEPRTAVPSIVENVERVRRGEAPLHLVDFAAGY